jgi:hypothetical protein
VHGARCPGKVRASSVRRSGRCGACSPPGAGVPCPRPRGPARRRGSAPVPPSPVRAQCPGGAA